MTPLCQMWAYLENQIRSLSTKQQRFYSLGQNIFRLSRVLAHYLFTTSEMELDYYHQHVNVRVASQVTESRKTFEVKKLENFNKISEMLGFDGEYTTAHPQGKF